MLAKIFIKAYVVLCCIQVALWGYLHQDMLWISIACINIVALFVILFQERKVFAHVGSSRVLFSNDVFAYLAVAIGLICSTWWYTSGSIFSSDVQWLVAVVIGGIFYLASVWIFGMFGEKKLSDMLSIRIMSIVLAGLFAYICIIHASFTGLTTWISSFGTSVSEIVEIEDTVDEGSGALLEEDNDITIKEIDALLENIDINKDLAVDEVEDSQANDTQLLTFGNTLPVIVDTYNLGPANGVYSFTFVSQDSDLYEPFAVAREYAMIGSATNPNQPVLCKHLMVLIGLAEGRDVSGSTDVFNAYRTVAQERGYLASCSDLNQQARLSDIPTRIIP